MKRFVLIAGLAVIFVFSITCLAINGTANSTNPRSGAELYNKECASCHGKDGRSKTQKGKRKRARNLTDPEWQNSVSDERLFNAIMNGKGEMPGFSEKVSEQETGVLVSYVRGLKQ